MPSGSLEQAPLSAADVIYLDTSALYALTVREVKASGFRIEDAQLELDRAERITQFAVRVAEAGARICTTVLAFEEVAAIARRQERAAELAQTRYRAWADFEANDQAAAKAANERARQKVLSFLVKARDALRNLPGHFSWMECDAADVAQYGEELRDIHHDLLRVYRGLDPMDALHVAIGTAFESTIFVSFDYGWANLREVTVLC